VAAPSGPRHVTVGAQRLSKWIDGFADRHGAIEVNVTETAVTITGADGDRATITVPFPPFTPDSARPLTSFLVHVRRERRIGVLLVRRGGYAAGVFQGSRLVSSKVGSAYVQGATKAGGWSQQRFARRRANQAAAAFGEAADVAARVLLPEVAELDAVVCGGDRDAVRSVLADRRLTPLAAKVTDPWLAIPDPRHKVLSATPADFLALTISLDP